MRHAPLLLAALLLGACGSKIDAVQETPCATAAAVTYEGEISAWAARFCTSCHAASRAGSDRNGAPVGADLDSFAAAAALAAESDRRVQAGTMPPGDPKPTAAEREAFHCWVTQGAKER